MTRLRLTIFTKSCRNCRHHLWLDRGDEPRRLTPRITCRETGGRAVRVYALAEVIRRSFALSSFAMETPVLRHCDKLKVSPVLLHYLPSREFPLFIIQFERSDRIRLIPVP